MTNEASKDDMLATDVVVLVGSETSPCGCRRDLENRHCLPAQVFEGAKSLYWRFEGVLRVGSGGA